MHNHQSATTTIPAQHLPLPRVHCAEISSPRTGAAQISVTSDPDGLTLVRVAGEIDLRVIDDLRDRLSEAVRTADLSVVLDLTEVEFLSAAGISVLIDTAREARDRDLPYSVATECLAVLRPLRVLNCLELVPVQPTVREAIMQVAEPLRG